MSDYNGDNFDDLAIGVPGDSVGAKARVGAANVLFGASIGLEASGNQLWHQDSAGVQGLAETGDVFGSALAGGDFNNDGYDDLVAGVYGEDIGSAENAGAINVIAGSSGGLTGTGSHMWYQGFGGLAGAAESDDDFGRALATGDFNNDGFDDLAVGVRGQDLGGRADVGAVSVMFGSTAGLTTTGNQTWHQDVAGVAGVAESGDIFGTAVATGDFNNDGYDDLAVGVAGEDVGAVSNAGAIEMLRGSASGLTAAGSQTWSQGIGGIAGASEESDAFGGALAVGDFNNDGFDDLAVGVSGEDIGAAVNAGAINVLQGSRSGLSANGNQQWHQNSAGIAGVAEGNDQFGTALASGDFNNDGYADLAVGAPGEDRGTVQSTGQVTVLYGSGSGLAAAGSQSFTQDSPGVAGAAETGDVFGDVLVIGDFNNDGFDDLAIGAPGEDIGSISSAGSATVLFGSANGLTPADDQQWHQDVAGILGVAQGDDAFGGAFA